jgi:hypothetical protein
LSDVDQLFLFYLFTNLWLKENKKKKTTVTAKTLQTMSQKTSTPLGIHLIAGGTAGFAEVRPSLKHHPVILREAKAQTMCASSLKSHRHVRVILWTRSRFGCN